MNMIFKLPKSPSMGSSSVAVPRSPRAPPTPLYRSKTDPNFDAFSGLAFAPSWFRPGNILAPFWLLFRSKMALGHLLASKTPIFWKQNVFQQKTWFFLPQTAPQTTAHRPKSPPRLHLATLKFRPRLGIDFDSILPPQKPPPRHPFATIFGNKIDQIANPC